MESNLFLPLRQVSLNTSLFHTALGSRCSIDHNRSCCRTQRKTVNGPPWTFLSGIVIFWFSLIRTVFAAPLDNKLISTEFLESLVNKSVSGTKSRCQKVAVSHDLSAQQATLVIVVVVDRFCSRCSYLSHNNSVLFLSYLVSCLTESAATKEGGSTALRTYPSDI